jgi:hypothetical protein
MTKRVNIRSSTRLFWLVLLFFGAVFVAKGTTFARLSVSQMSQRAAAIIRARCLANTVVEVSGEIWTLTTFDVQEIWRGAVPVRITVRLLGGTTRNVASHVAGVPRFRPGEQVILFLASTKHFPSASSQGDFSVVSWQQGTFRIQRDRGTGEELASQDTGGYSTFDPASRRFVANGGVRMPVALFHAQVTSANDGTIKDALERAH